MPDILTAAEVWSALSLTGRNTSRDNEILALVQKPCERLVERNVGFGILQSTYTEYWPVKPDTDPVDPLIDGYDVYNQKVIPQFRRGRDRSIMTVKRTPLRSVTSIHENENAWDTDPSTWPSDREIVAGDYQVDFDEPGISHTGVIWRRTGIWTDRLRCVRVVYVAGYTADELGDAYADVKLAVLYTTVYNFNVFKMQSNRSSILPGAVTSFKLDTLAVTYDAATMAQLYGLKISLPPVAQVILEPLKNYAAFL